MLSSHADCRPAAGDPVESYRARDPEQSILYRVLLENLETFLARRQDAGRNVPQFIEREMRAFLDCGILACGFLRLQCESCRKEKLVPFSCKGRAVCPSCCGRRMVDTAAHLVDREFPRVPVRECVVSLPFGLRYVLAHDPKIVTAVFGIFAQTVFAFLRQVARDYGIDQTQCGAVTFIQRFGGSVNLKMRS